MHSGKAHNETEEKMTLSKQLLCDSSLANKSPTQINKSLELHSPPNSVLPKIRSKSKGNSRSDATKIGAHYNLLPHKLRLNKIFKNETTAAVRTHLNTKAHYNGEDDGRSEIRVLSPSIVNSQVLPRTRPLSPEQVQISTGLQDENKDTTLRVGWKDEKSRRNEDTMKGRNEGERDQESCKGKGKGKRRQRLFKLKFHHQALPPEYLDHYEASLRQQQQNVQSYQNGARDQFDRPKEIINSDLQSGLRQGPRNKTNKVPRGNRPITIHQAGNGATEALLRDLLVASPRLQQVALQQAEIVRAQSVPSVMLASGNNKMGQYSMNMPPPSPAESMCADDQLSYASDMSIDECPKKGKNSRKNSTSSKLGRGLGSAGLGTLGGDSNERMSSHGAANDVEPILLAAQYTMLEKQALARSRSHSSLNYGDQHEPLNLCVRDESKEYRYNDNQFHIDGIKTEPDLNIDDDREQLDLNMRSPCITPHDYPSWQYNPSYFPGNPHWLHDYRLKTEDGLSSGHSTPSMCSQSSHLPCLSPPVWPHFSPPPYSPSPVPPMSPLTPPQHSRHIQNLIKDSLHNRYDEGDREKRLPRESCIRSPSRSGGISSSFRLSSIKSGARRKRSALFIPPADPNTEVSICKFKFTGGVNPILEEKKMVRVDSRGTLRYFNASDKLSAREGNVKISGKMLESLSKCEKDVKKIRLESDNDETCSLPGGGGGDAYSTATSPTGTLEDTVQSSCTTPGPIEDSPKRKRRSKKSSVREKLEQTLREKGLLIQTQQIESAEGATYCKFRQLRKITRYLFRSWKDYLPGQIHDDLTTENLQKGTTPYYRDSIHQSNINMQLPTYER